MLRALVAAAAALTVAGVAQAAGTKTIRDWTGVCDNVGDCSAFGFSPEGGDDDSYVILRRRAGGAAQPSIEIVFDAPEREPAQVWSVAIDHKPVAGLGAVRALGSESGARAKLTAEASARLIAAMKQGRELELSDGGAQLTGVSLDGSAGMLLWLDDQQGRVGTVTALGRKGPKPASAVPPPGSAPVVAVAATVSQAGAPKLAPKGMTKSIDECDLDPSVTPDDIVARLAPGVMLWGPQCQMAAYNELNVFFIGDERGRNLKRVTFPAPPGSGEKSYDTLFNATFDPKTQTLSQFAKGRGVADCGESDAWAWDGRGFQLVSATGMPECRGLIPDDWPTLYVTRPR